MLLLIAIRNSKKHLARQCTAVVEPAVDPNAYLCGAWYNPTLILCHLLFLSALANGPFVPISQSWTLLEKQQQHKVMQAC